MVVVCVNPQWRRRWCRDGIPDPGNAAQIAITPELPSASLLCAIEVLPCHWIAGEAQLQVHGAGAILHLLPLYLSSLFATKQIPQQSVSVNKLTSVFSSSSSYLTAKCPSQYCFQAMLICKSKTSLQCCQHQNVHLVLHLRSQLNSSIKAGHQ